MEYVYKLSAIGIDELVRSRNELEFPYADQQQHYSYGGAQHHNIKSVVKEEYLRYLDIHWKNCIVFAKHRDCKGIIHRDGIVDEKFCWAINWVWNSDCTLDYWNDEQIIREIFEKDKVGGTRIRGVTTSSPAKSYVLETGNVYLVNTKQFHLPGTVGPNMRYTLSIRDPLSPLKDWMQTVDYFSNRIIK